MNEKYLRQGNRQKMRSHSEGRSQKKITVDDENKMKCILFKKKQKLLTTSHYFYRIFEDNRSSWMLESTCIRPSDRQKLKSWMMQEASRRNYRETYATASKYLDLYFAEGQTISRQSFQSLGLACFILASKIVERRVPLISYKIFDRKQILGLEIKICLTLNYKLNIITYVSIAELVMMEWDYYLDSNLDECGLCGFSKILYFKGNGINVYRSRCVMETLDCLDLIHWTLDYYQPALVLEVFFLENRRFCYQQFVKNKRKDLELYGDLEQIKHQFHQQYTKISKQFQQTLSQKYQIFKNINPSQNLKHYIQKLSRLCPKVNKNNNNNYSKQIRGQTYNPEISKIARRYIMKQSYLQSVSNENNTQK